MFSKIRYLLLILTVFILHSCLEKEEFPNIPHIEYKSFTKINNSSFDDKGILTISFTDGDGNIGLRQKDTTAPYVGLYYYNFIIKYFEKQNGVFTEVEFLDPHNNIPIVHNARIPLVKNTGSTSSLKGDIDIELFINNFTSLYDTIRFEAYIIDRDLNHSNAITTHEIIIKKF